MKSQIDFFIYFILPTGGLVLFGNCFSIGFQVPCMSMGCHAIIFSVLSGNHFYPETVLTGNVFLHGCTIYPEAANNPWVLCLLSSLPHNKDNRSDPSAFFCMPDNAMLLFADIFYPLLTIIAMKTDKNLHDRLHKQDMPYRCFSYC